MKFVIVVSTIFLFKSSNLLIEKNIIVGMSTVSCILHSIPLKASYKKDVQTCSCQHTQGHLIIRYIFSFDKPFNFGVSWIDNEYVTLYLSTS